MKSGISIALLALCFSFSFGEAEASAPVATVLANTEYVEAIAVDGEGRSATLYAATRGGVEVYALSSGERLRHYTHLDGLPSLHVRALRVGDDGTVLARFPASECELVRDSFRCRDAAPLPTPEPSVAPRFEGSRVTQTLEHASGILIATAGNGVWLGKRRLTPSSQICSNHMMAVSEYRGRTYFGSFDGGLCSTKDGKTFVHHDGPFRMVNDLEATPKGLFVASGEGLYKSRDGETFEKVESITQRGANGLSFDGKSLWVTTPGALWRLRVQGGPRTRGYWLPGNARSVQAVHAKGGEVWIATEDRGLIRKKRGGWEIHDKAAGMPSSWFLDVAIANDGTVYGASLRDGIVSIQNDGSVKRVEESPDAWGLFVSQIGGHVAMGTQGGAGWLGGAEVPALPDPNVHAITAAGGWMVYATEGGTMMQADSPNSVAVR